MGHTEGKWKTRATSTKITTLENGERFDQVTTITVSTRTESRFWGKNIAKIDVFVPDELLTMRNGDPDKLRILINNCHYPLKVAEANARLIASSPELLVACRIGLSYIEAVISGVPRPIQDLQEDKEQVERAIADAE